MTEGLREKKMRVARRAMEEAAVGIAYEEGVHAVTVDRICEVAMVSRSTFFNYFPSLEHAIFGSALVYDPVLTERILSAHRDDLVIAASRIVMETVRGQGDDELLRKRFALFAREPGTATKVSWAAGTSRAGLQDVIVNWLDAHPASARLVQQCNRGCGADRFCRSWAAHPTNSTSCRSLPRGAADPPPSSPYWRAALWLSSDQSLPSAPSRLVRQTAAP